MAKKNIGRSFNIFPMPVVIVGTVTDGKPNFMTAAWVTKLNSDPPLLGLSLGRKQHTAKGIEQTQEFSVSFPSVDQVMLTDYLGLVHGYEEDKAAHVDMFRGALKSAPMVRRMSRSRSNAVWSRKWSCPRTSSSSVKWPTSMPARPY